MEVFETDKIKEIDARDIKYKCKVLTYNEYLN